MRPRYESFADFYPFYLSEHRDRTCRRLHFAGSLLVCVAERLLGPRVDPRLDGAR
jgi:hypothetical protein